MQIFGNGNKRTALCFANLCLLKNNQSIIVIKDRTKYTNMLASYYDNETRLYDFIKYLQSCAVQVDINSPDYQDLISTIPNLGTTDQKVMFLLKQNSRLSAKKIAKILGLSERQIQRALATLTKEGNIKHLGSKKAGFYEITKKIRAEF